MSPASFWTSVTSSLRSLSSSADSGAALVGFLPGILIIKKHPRSNVAATAEPGKISQNKNRRTTWVYWQPPGLTDFCAKTQGADTKQECRHDGEDDEVRPVFKEMCSTKDDRPHERDKIGCGQQRTERREN